MAEGALSTGDLALMRDNDGFGGGNGFFWVFALLILMFGGNGFGFGGGRPDMATADQVNQGFTNQNLQQIALSSANNNYETAQLINGLGNTLQQQNNSNLINAIQGFNALGLQITNQTNVITQQLMNLQSKMDSCCCEIKTQMLQNRYEDARARNVSLENEISNFQQSQYILGQMGRWVAWVGNGSQTAAATT
jgi:hypothetical protein